MIITIILSLISIVFTVVLVIGLFFLIRWKCRVSNLRVYNTGGIRKFIPKDFELNLK